MRRSWPDLYPFQAEGAEFLLGRRRAYLADDPGLGKTVQACAAASRAGLRRVLAIVPASTLDQWREAWQVWGTDGAGPIDAVSYASGELDRLDGRDYDAAILDEAHYVKSMGSQRTKRALRLAAQAPRSWLLSATPAPNGPWELYAPLRVLWPGILDELGVQSLREWEARFTRFAEGPRARRRRRPLRLGAKNAGQLRPHLRRIMLRRTLDDVGIELPPLRVDTVVLNRDESLDVAVRAAGYDPVELRQGIAAEDTEDGSSSRLLRLLGTLKAPLIAERLAEELATGRPDKIVVVGYHKEVLRVFSRRLERYGVAVIDGGTPAAERGRALRRFRTAGSVRVLVGQRTAMGVGTDLPVANELVLAEPAWGPEENYQIIKRIHRIGQTRPCRARIFLVAGTIDEAIMRTEARKLESLIALGLAGEERRWTLRSGN